jgi:hypothetical protein
MANSSAASTFDSLSVSHGSSKGCILFIREGRVGWVSDTEILR